MDAHKGSTLDYLITPDKDGLQSWMTMGPHVLNEQRRQAKLLEHLDNVVEWNEFLWRETDIHYEEMFCMRSLDTDIDRRTDVDPILFEDCIDRELVIADKHFNGAVKELIIFIRSHELEAVQSPVNGRQYRAVVELNNITADQYKYRKSYRAYRDSDGNPFAEPVLVYTNIKHGYGLFSTYNLAVDTIR